MTVSSPGKVAGTSALTSIASGAIDTKGSYVQLVASLGFESRWIIVDFDSGAIATAVDGLLDIGVDPAGGSSYSVKLPDLLIWGSTSSLAKARYAFPLKIPAGASVAARWAADTASVSINVGLTLGSEGPLPTIDSVEALGIVTTGSHGTSVDPGAVANTKGTYVEFVASSSKHYCGLLVAAKKHTGTVGVLGNHLLDVATGTGGAEAVQIPDIWQHMNVGSDQNVVALSEFIWHTFPASSRIAVRDQCSDTDAADRVIEDVALYMGVANNDVPKVGQFSIFSSMRRRLRRAG